MIAFIWFEFIERMLGLDKRKAHELQEKARQERVKKAFEKYGTTAIAAAPSTQ